MTNPTLAIITFKALPTKDEHKILKDNGIELLEYVPDNTFFAIVNNPQTSSLSNATNMIGIESVRAEWKADNYVWDKAHRQKSALDLMVSFYPIVSDFQIRSMVSSLGGQVKYSPKQQNSFYEISIAPASLVKLADWYGVRNISLSSPMYPLDFMSRPAVKGNIAVKSVTMGGYGLAGDSVTVGVGDNASGIYHADLYDRITNFNPVGISHHGEHVNGIVGGSGNLDPFAEGMAPHVNLLDYFYDLVLSATGAMRQDYNMTITNNSYGVILGDCGYSGTYDGYSQYVDTLALLYPDVLHVFASGNDGWMNCSPYPQGFGTVGGGYQTAKNNVVVGSMTDFLSEASDESRGPTLDGRLKPEIIAIGLGAYSTIDIDEYEWAAGTSMASPQVAGGLALLTQRYKQLNSGANPPNYVLKSILLNGAMDLGNAGPDYSYGYGAMDLSRSLQILEHNWFTTNTVNDGDSQTIIIPVPANTGRLKVMLCWNDHPASASAAKQLVNDLDLSVTTPSSTVHLPLTLDPTPANVTNVAVEKADHLNNTEQVTIMNPTAGNYFVKVKGYHIPFHAQDFVVVYDMEPVGVKLTFPSGGETIDNIDSMRIFWDAVGNTGTFSLLFSSDSGANWQTISNFVGGDQRYYSWIPSGVNSGNCMVRIVNNATGDFSGSDRFAINAQPIIKLAASQCPGYISIHWSPVVHADSYQVLIKKGIGMKAIATTNDTAFVLAGMPTSAKSYVAVRPIINGLPAYRSVAIGYTANSGNCSNPVSAGDLMLEQINSPIGGRQNTSTQLSSSSTISLKIRNLYTTTCTNYSISLSINGGPWSTISPTTALAANTSTSVNIGGIDLSSAGSYQIAVAVTNLALTDPVHQNDTFWSTLANIPNDTLTLPFNDGFESLPAMAITGHDSIGLSPNGHWDFHTNDSVGRIRSFVSSDVTISGNRSMSMDEDRAVTNGSRNLMTGTFNLSNHDTSTTELRCDFDYMLAGTPKSTTGNLLQIRPTDTSPWATFYNYNLGAFAGFVQHARSISVTDAMRNSGHNFSPSVQFAFGQNDTSLIATYNYGNGMTIDNFSLYTVTNDAQLLSVVSPLPSNCGMPTTVPFTVQVHNGVNYTLHNIQLNFRQNGGTINTGTIDSIPAKATVDFTFSAAVSAPFSTTESLDIWLTAPGDSYSPNDSINGYKFRNNNVYASFPYLQDFESGNGGYYSDGFNDTWQYGTPASVRINHAASGTHAWKTNLTGHYKDLEQSYLYSPCFDISSLSNPMLSFSAALDVENCGGVMCDKAYVEYSFNSVDWFKLGNAGQGTNWYDPSFDVWNTEGFTRWHVASIPLPKPPTGETIHFRFALASDPGANYEGFAIDDIHIYDLVDTIHAAKDTIQVTQSPAILGWTDLKTDGGVIASVIADINTGALNGTLYQQKIISNPGKTQFIFPRSYTMHKPGTGKDSSNVRLYLLESDFIAAVNDTTCPSCEPVSDAYSLGITQYKDSLNQTIENASLADDTGSLFSYYKNIKWVPFDKGYYAEFKTPPQGEYWFNNGGPTHNIPAGTDAVNFIAFRSTNDARLVWHSIIDTSIASYTLQRSSDGVVFNNIFHVNAANISTATYTYNDANVFPTDSVLWYRLRWAMIGGDSLHYSPIRQVSATDTLAENIILDAHMNAPKSVLLTWTSFVDGATDHYLLKRSIDGQDTTLIFKPNALRHYGQLYTFVDQPTSNIPQGGVLTYQLTAVLDNGAQLSAPLRFVEWGNENQILSIFPNPSSNGDMTLLWCARPGASMSLSIHDAAGKFLYTTSEKATQWTNYSTLHTTNLTKGIYIVTMSIDGLKNSFKVVFE